MAPSRRIAIGIAVMAALIVIAGGMSSARAQQAPAISSVTLEPKSAHIGQRLTLTIEVDHDEQFRIEGPGYGDDFGDLDLVEVIDPASHARDGSVLTTLKFTLTSFKLGSVTVPPLPIRWRGPAGEATLRTTEQTAIIDTVLPPGDTELRGPKPQLEIAVDAPSPLFPATFVAMFAALTAAGYVLARRAIDARPAPASVAPVRPPTPAEAARASLDALATGEHNDLREHYARLAAAVRRYLSDRYGFPAYAMTRTELGRHMTAAGLGRWPARLTANLLEQCDAVQFAGFSPARERADADLTAAYEIVALGETQAEGDGTD